MIKNQRFKTLLLLTLVLLFSSCKKKLYVNTYFYYWKTIYQEKEIKSLIKNSQKLYVRLCDVDIENGLANTIAPIIWKEKPSIQIVPVIYITNRTIDYLEQSNMDSLAQNIINFSNSNVPKFTEIQIDCDWNTTTMEKYFFLLTAIKQKLNKNQILSTTIRLHQVKFSKKTGVPPVDRGLLMLYNMAPLRNYNTFNSIFDDQIIDSYLDKISQYELPLDLALPHYKQLVVFKNHNYVDVIRGSDFFEISQNDHFEHRHGNIYKCIKDTTLKNIFIEKEDEIRVEIPNTATFDRFQHKISNINKVDTLNLVYFDIHSYL